jgi:hypothetical protein
VIDGSPQIRLYPVARQHHLVQGPCVLWAGTAAAHVVGIILPEVATPLPDRFSRQDNPTSEQEHFHITVAEAEPKVQPHAMADNLSWEAVMLVSMSRWWTYEATMAHQVAMDKPFNKLTMPASCTLV